MNNQIDTKRVKSLMRTALRKQGRNKLHLFWLTILGIKHSYITSYENHPRLRFVMPPLFLILFLSKLYDCLFDFVWCTLSSLFPGITYEIHKEHRNKVMFTGGLAGAVYVLAVVKDNEVCYHYACDIDHADDLWEGNYD